MKLSPFKIESPLLILRNYKLSDAPSLFQLIDFNKNILKDYFPMSVENNTSVMASRKYILDRNSDRRNGKSLFAGIFTATTKQLVGQICVKEINWRVPKCEAGYFLDKNFHGKGLGEEALKLFSSYCFEELQMQKITLRIEPGNSASQKLAGKCGFEMIGVAKNDFRSSDGRLMECELWEKII
ncbi:MAG: GNAT family N-acetyltransferase [Bacteroidota bacterium]|nr:GNAT family N-acetyltransferase [Bacteroidota bacterium]